MFFKGEAENCRQQALGYLQRPERPFLLSVARAFDKLADTQVGRETTGTNRPMRNTGILRTGHARFIKTCCSRIARPAKAKTCSLVLPNR